MSFVVEISISTTLITILNHSLDFTSTVTFTDKVKGAFENDEAQ